LGLNHFSNAKIKLKLKLKRLENPTKLNNEDSAAYDDAKPN
jgi:hypothetical protein